MSAISGLAAVRKPNDRTEATLPDAEPDDRSRLALSCCRAAAIMLTSETLCAFDRALVGRAVPTKLKHPLLTVLLERKFYRHRFDPG